MANGSGFAETLARPKTTQSHRDHTGQNRIKWRTRCTGATTKERAATRTRRSDLFIIGPGYVVPVHSCPRGRQQTSLGHFLTLRGVNSRNGKNRTLRILRLYSRIGRALAAGGFTHVIAGSNEIFTLVLNGIMNIFTALIYHISPVLIGNILGGTGLFAMLAFGQIQEEM